MMAVYRMSESNPAFLTNMVTAPPEDKNLGLEIQPKQAVSAGESVSVQEALNDMIMYSDNNAYYALAAAVDTSTYNAIFTDLQVPNSSTPSIPSDYISAKDFAYFLRVLHNGTYIGRDNSESALELLAKSDFSAGITASLPASVTVAHKFGIETNGAGGIFDNRELHDCGMVYQADKSYLLCIMTNSTASLSNQESVLAGISGLVYQVLGMPS